MPSSGEYLSPRLSSRRPRLVEETDGDDHDRAVGTLGQQAAVKGYGIAVVPVSAAAGEKSRLADGACVVVAFEHHAITDPPDRNFGIAVPRIHHIYIAGRELGILAAENAEQGDFTPVHRLVKHIERQRIVHVVAHVGIENHPQGVRAASAAPGPPAYRGRQAPPESKVSSSFQVIQLPPERMIHARPRIKKRNMTASSQPTERPAPRNSFQTKTPQTAATIGAPCPSA